MDKSCLNREKYLRALIMGHSVHPQPCEEYIEVFKILSSSANKIDDITRIVSKTGHASEKDIYFLKLMTQKLWDKFQEMDSGKYMENNEVKIEEETRFVIFGNIMASDVRIGRTLFEVSSSMTNNKN